MLFTYVKVADNIKACIREEIVSCKSIDLVSASVQYESLDMMNTLLSEKVVSLEKSLQNETLTEEEIKGIQKKIEKLEEEIEENSKTMRALNPRWESAIKIISEAHNEYVKNDTHAVRNILRLTACQDNSKLYKYVVTNGTDNTALYEAMECIHQLEDRDIDDMGRLIDGENQNDDYAFSAAEIGKIAKSLFSLPVESELTKKINIKFNKTDLAYIHSLYVRSLNVRFSNSKSRGTVYEGRTLKTLIQCKKDKEGKTTYDFTRFYEVLSKLAIEYLVK